MYETHFIGAFPSDKLAMVGGGVSLLEVDGVIGSFFVILDLRDGGKKISFLRSALDCCHLEIIHPSPDKVWMPPLDRANSSLG